MSHNRKVVLDTITVDLDDLLLDPNNPRFVESLRISEPVSDDRVEAAQDQVLARFDTGEEPESLDDDEDDIDEGFFGIKDLIDSMKAIGFVPIDQVVVRKLANGPKYLVLEGNRRISAAKRLRIWNEKETDPGKKLRPEILASLESVQAKLLVTERVPPEEPLSPEEIAHQIGVILGLRHYGSVLQWKPLPKAVNIFNEYMGSDPILQEFEMIPKRVTAVHQRLSVPRTEIQRALDTYIVYRQLHESFPVGPAPKHYSLLESIVTNSKLQSAKLVKRDPKTRKLDHDSLEWVNNVGQFERREEHPDKTILNEPKAVTKLARVAFDAVGHEIEAVRLFANGILEAVMQGEKTLDDADYQLKSFRAARQWTDTLRKYLKTREEKLKYNDFRVRGNDLLEKERAEKAFKNIAKVLGVEVPSAVAKRAKAEK